MSLLLLLLLCAWCLTGDHMRAMAILEQDAELETQINLSNNSIVTTIMTKNGEIYDCVDFYKQPAFNHPALKNHNFHPTVVPEMKSRLDFGYIWKNGKGCPLGSVPIKRTIKDDLTRIKLATEIYATNDEPLRAGEIGTHYAILRTNDGTRKMFNGGGMFASEFTLYLSRTQYSATYLKIKNGQDSIEVGWMVNPALYNDTKTRYFIYTKTGRSHCFNMYCPGFVSVRSDMPVDSLYTLESVRGTEQIYGDYLLIYRDTASNNWWFALGPNQTKIGYWPQKIFTGLSNMATSVEWGGKVFSRPIELSPPMGAGEELKDDSRFDAMCSKVTTINESHAMVDAKDVSIYADIEEYYRVIDRGFYNQQSRRVFFFGGNGGYIGN